MAPEFGCRCRQRRRHLREESALLEEKCSPSHPSTSQSVSSTSTLRIESNNNNNNNRSCCWPSDVVIRCNLKRTNVLDDRDGNFARLESHNFEEKSHCKRKGFVVGGGKNVARLRRRQRTMTVIRSRLPMQILFLFFALNTFWYLGTEATFMSNEHQQQPSSSSSNSNGDDSIQWEENPAYQNEPVHFGVNTTYISQILNRLTDKTKYDKRLRPRYGEGAVDVGISIHITSISAVSEVDMDFTLDFYLRQTWYDQRLAFAQIDPELARRIKKLTVGVDYLDRLWKPDTFFPNEKTSMFHMATTPNTFLRIEPDGRIYTSQRMTVKAMCPMDLALFPMDSQTCKLGLESYGYDVDDIDYYWGERRSDGKKPEDAVAFDDFFLPQFRRTGYRVTGTHIRTSSGEYARLYIEVILTRNLGFYLMNIIVPSMLIVSISWVSFWLSREASPARVGLGVTTVLTMTTLITTTNNSMPKVSYIKGLDVFLNFCFVMVFASLVEYAVVSYWNKRQCRRRDRRERIRSAPAASTAGVQHSDSTATAFSAGQMAAAGTEYPMFMNLPTTPAGGLAIPSPNTQSYVYRAPGLLVAAPVGNASSMLQAQPANTNQQQPQQTIGSTTQQQQQGTTTQMPVPPDCDCRLGNISLVQYATAEYQQQQPHHPQLGLSNSMPYLMPVTPSKLNRRQRRRPYSYYGGMGGFGGMNSSRSGLCRTLLTCRRLNPSKIDRLSRCGFPLMFILFNFFYWSALTFMSQRALENVDFVAFT